MNAKDLDNINWILMNGQTHERIHLLSLISQIIKLTSNAKANINDESLTNDVHTVATLQQATPGNSQSNVNDASSAPRFRERKRRRTEHSQHNRTAPALQDSEFDLNETHTLEIGDTSDQIQEQHGQTTPRLEDRQTISELESDQAQTIEIVDISHEITQTWTKCTVKIEAIKYIPCFVKVTLIQQNNDDDKSNIVIKINIPGLGVQLASSRSKIYSYGLFWTHHRKNCCIFFALDSRNKLERHIKWVQNSIITLELHRREMLELRRASRISKIDDSVLRSLNTSVDTDEPRCNETQDIRDINDILGPLPKVPDSNINWSRRISSTSEIYEEIGDGDLLSRNMARKLSRASIASGIYEVMTSPLVPIDESPPILEEMPPPLPPPRPRLNTQSEMNRAYTNPESISAKKRKKNIFETVFSRHKSMQKRKPVKEKEIAPKPESPILELLRSHRMSYSSPDLSKVDINHYVNEFESDLMARSSATEFSIRNEHSFLNSTASSEKQFDEERNISANILSTFNISCNDSTVNLVGSKLNVNTPKTPVATIIDDQSGYCQMAPIIRSDNASSPVQVAELPPKSPYTVSTMNQSRFPFDVTKTITFCRDYGMEASIQNFENLTISKDSSQKSLKETKAVASPSPSDPMDYKKTSDSPKPCRLSGSFDKYPSYYPNDAPKTPLKDCRKNDGINYLTKVGISPERAENVYIATPRHGTTTYRTKSSNEPSSKSPFLTPSNKPSLPGAISSASPLYQKYATVTPIKVGDSSSCKKSSDITSSMKRFSSLPRFKKIDFSPLKLKINSVLQRQNPDQM